MFTPTPPKNESPYQRFTQKPGKVCNHHGWRPDHLSITDRDGSTLYETDGGSLFNEIIQLDDVETLEKYFSVEPRAIPKLHSLPEDDEAFYDLGMTFHNAICDGSLGVIRLLASHELKYSESTEKIRFDKFIFHLLTHAARWGQIEMVKFFLDNQPLYADINDRDHWGNTALSAVADIHQHRYAFPCPECWDFQPEKNEAMMNLLLDRGACASDAVLPFRGCDETRNTVLTLASKWSSYEMIKRLIDCGADIHAKVTYSAWDLGLHAGEEDFHVTALFIACIFSNSQATKCLINHRGDNIALSDMLYPRNIHGLFPIHWAARKRPVEDYQDIPEPPYEKWTRDTTDTIALLLEHDTSMVNIKDGDGNTPLHHSVHGLGLNERYCTSVLEFLCDRGADASMCNNKGQTPLHVLCCNTSLPVSVAAVSILLNHGANPTTADIDGNTPVHLAALRLDSIDTMAFLLDNGGDPAQLNSNCETAFDRVATGTFSFGVVKSGQEITKAKEEMLSTMVKSG
ncbi:hypothetical protein FLONG3_7870 [Fusarium longipes]|uniref:Uncharacterized protein n=1 Tax=Fusarium longipes TaxID=694270 RepID=A0A395S9Z6_9HYPO|nr:hypothetical protein FLONG3_7870 [Fusarium longipes]